MKLETLVLKATVVVIGLAVLALCIIGLPWLAKEAAKYYPKSVYLPIVIGLYVTALPFFAALYQALQLLGYIDKNNAFSESSVRALGNIKLCAAAISIVYLVMLPLLYLIAERDDAPGILAFALVIISVSIVIAAFASVLQRLSRSAVDVQP